MNEFQSVYFPQCRELDVGCEIQINGEQWIKNRIMHGCRGSTSTIVSFGKRDSGSNDGEEYDG